MSDGIGSRYLGAVSGIMQRILVEEGAAVSQAAALLADQIEQNRLAHRK